MEKNEYHQENKLGVSMSYEFTPVTPKRSKRGLFFIAPLVLLLARNFDLYFIWHESMRLAETWIFTILIFFACVVGVVSVFFPKYSRIQVLIGAITYSSLVVIWDCYQIFYDFFAVPMNERILYVTRLPTSGRWVELFFRIGFHQTIYSIMTLALFLSIPLLIALAFWPQKRGQSSLSQNYSANIQQNVGLENLYNAPTASYLPPINQEVRTGERVNMNMNMNPNAQWVVKMPGQQDQAVDTGTLAMWARSGVIRPESLVIDANSGMTYQANQIPGIFSTKQYVTTLLLSFFLGGIGVDRFYLGYTGLGVAKLLTLGGCGIWSLVDFILIAMRKVTDSQGNPLS